MAAKKERSNRFGREGAIGAEKLEQKRIAHRAYPRRQRKRKWK